MTPRTFSRRVNILLRTHGPGELSLVCRRFPLHIGYLVERPQMPIGIPVTVETPAHAERFGKSHLFHLVHPTVATDTPHSGRHVRRVIEVSIVREVVDANPFYRLLSGKALAHQGQFFTVRVDHRMTVHTGPSWRHVGLRLALHPGMTIATINAQIPGVNFV